MPTGTLKLEVSDLTGAPVAGLWVEFAPKSAGGEKAKVDAGQSARSEITVNGISCLGGSGTLYQVTAGAPHFRPYSFFQRMIAGAKNTPSDGRVLLVTDVKKVKGIAAPAFGSLAAAVRNVVGSSTRYDSFSPMQKACLLNVAAKARHGTADRCLRHVGRLLKIEQDRCFCEVAASMPAFLQRSDRFKTVNGSLHTPLPGYVREESYKSRDAHANLQVTLMRKKSADEWAADIDIDEASGIEHGFEVIRNKVTGGKTNPYQIHELLLLADWQERTLDPGYRFLFGHASEPRL
ncbi:MAG: hypothetical protein HXY18_03500 [Bryobacteraceae bacterium]|nr:hypothetical protein [Bryobacteraceae bacterium]